MRAERRGASRQGNREGSRGQTPRRDRPPPPDTGRYSAIERYQVTLGNRVMQAVSKPGLDARRRASAAADLLAEYVTIPAAARVLLFGCGNGALGAFFGLKYPDCSLVLNDPSCIAVEMSRLTLEANEVKNALVSPAISVLPTLEGAFDAVLLEMPKGRQLLRRWLVEALAALKPGGQLYLAGANDEGIQPAVKDAEELFGDAEILCYRGRNRVVRIVRPDEALQAPSWAEEPGIRPGTWCEFDVTASGQTYHIRSLPGVFSFDRLDEGTCLLLAHMKTPPGGRVLDVGCGYGILGLAAARSGAGTVEMVDANLLAVAAAKENAIANGAANTLVYPSDALSAVKDRFHLIVSNPPFHAGKSVDYQIAEAFISQSRRCLEPGGELLIVCNKFIRYDAPLRQFFGRADVAGENTKFHVLRAVRR